MSSGHERKKEAEDYWDAIKCHKCHGVSDEELMIECSAGCGRWFHTYCLHLSNVPEGLWACPYCAGAEMEGEFAVIGDVVFAKVEEFPWWPGVILGFADGNNDGSISSQVPRRGVLTRRNININFLHRGVYDKVDALRVVPFINGLEKLHNWPAASVGTSEHVAKVLCTQSEFKRALETAFHLAAERRAAVLRMSLTDARSFILRSTRLDQVQPPPLWTQITSSSDRNEANPLPTATANKENKHAPHLDKLNDIKDYDPNTRIWVQSMRAAGIDDRTLATVLRIRFESETLATTTTSVKSRSKSSQHSASSPETCGKKSSGPSPYFKVFPSTRKPTKRQRALISDSLPSSYLKEDAFAS